MRSGPLLFFGLAVAGALIGLAAEIPWWVMVGSVAVAAATAIIVPIRILKAVSVCIALIAFVAWEASSEKKQFDDTLTRLSSTQIIYEGVLVDLSDALNGDKIGLLEISALSQEGAGQPFTMALRLKDAASAKVMRIGDTVRVKGKLFKAQRALSPGQMDGYWYGLSRSVHGRMTLSNPHFIAVMKSEKPLPLMARIKQNLKDELKSYLTPREAGLLLALIVGDVKLFDDEEKAAYRNIGAGHLLAVSGLQVSILSVMIYRFFLFLFLLIPWVSQRSLARYPTLVVTLALVWGFVNLCGSPPSAFRAGLMASLVLCASVCAWPTISFDVFGAAGLLSLLLKPAWVVDPSFWLSYAAVFGLILAAEFGKVSEQDIPLMHPEKSATPWKEKLRAAAITSLGAGLLTLPFSIYFFGEISLSGLIVNIILVPVGGFLDSPAILLVALGVIAHLPFPCFDIAAFLATILESMVMTFDTWMGRTYPMMPTALWELFVGCVAAVALLACARPARRTFKAATAAICMALLFFPTLSESDSVIVTFLPVGQGDGAVLQIPPGKIMVIDGGGSYENIFNPGERVIAPFLRRRGINVIDVIVLSHPDADHLMGLIPLIENFEVGELWHSNFDDSHPLMARLLAAAHARGVRVRALAELPGRLGVATLTYFSPRAKNTSTELQSTNNRSLVMRLSYNGHSILFPGDVEAPLEEALRGQDLSSTIVKAPHHGSKSSSTPDFVRATKALHVVFCTGVNNRFGFPHSQVIKRWQDSGAILWDTAVNGETSFRLGGQAVQVAPFIATSEDQS
jgi:competence protein ComEC